MPERAEVQAVFASGERDHRVAGAACSGRCVHPRGQQALEPARLEQAELAHRVFQGSGEYHDPRPRAPAAETGRGVAHAEAGTRRARRSSTQAIPAKTALGSHSAAASEISPASASAWPKVRSA